MSNTTLAYHKVKSPASILGSPYPIRHCNQPPDSLASRARSSLLSPATMARLLITALIILLAGVAQAQRPAAAIHIVLPGETLGLIAQRYGVNMTDLAAQNSISDINIVHTWQELSIPGLSAESSATVAPAIAPPQSAPAGQAHIHVVQRGETLFRIALRYGISVDSLMSVNGITDATRIHAGNQLRISQLAASAPPAAAQVASNPPPAPPAAQAAAPAPDPAPVHQGDREQYIVRRGDFLTQLAIDLNTSWIALAKLNNLADPNNLHVGTTLLIPKREDEELYDPEYAAWKWFDMIANQPGARVGVGREIVIVLGTQSAYAYENGVLQKAARVSSGKKATPTIQGDHEIWLKRRSQTMSGPGYSLDNVEWVMYFYRDYAIHGTWWHMNFGQPMSHGCVNLTNADAQWFFNFASIGTPVHVRA